MDSRSNIGMRDLLSLKIQQVQGLCPGSTCGPPHPPNFEQDDEV
jgi:hypothetical protein